MNDGFVKGQSDNLPEIDGLMVAHYFSNNSDFLAAEMRGVKMQKSAKHSYGDDAIGYVQVKREGDICIVKCRITPEHRVRAKPYHCVFKCNESDREVLSIECEDCAASKGGCKHTIAFLMWLHRRSEEPATTAVKCYWKKSTLSGVGSTQKFIKAKDFGTHQTQNQNNDSNFFDTIVPKLSVLKIQCTLTNYTSEKPEIDKISIHYLISIFKKTSPDLHVDNFLEFCSNEMTESRCSQVKNATLAQSDSNLWFQMRYGRITASKIHEVAHCTTKDGCLVEVIFGASKFKETAPIQRGKMLENNIRKEVGRLKKLEIEQSGLILDRKCPIFGVSPDGITNEFVIEIKCPFKQNTFRCYYENGKIGPKYYAQIQAQMHVSGRKKGLFCIAHTDFEKSKQVDIYEVMYDEQYSINMFKQCEIFWRDNIYDKLIN